MFRTSRSDLYLASLLAVSLSLSGCISSAGITPKAKRLDNAQLLTDKAIRKAEKAADWPQAQWWQAYGDPQLNAWVDMAQAGSPDLAVAAARVRRAQALAGVAGAAQAPQVNYAASMQHKKWPTDNFYGPGPLADASTWNNTELLGLSFDLDLWGRLRSNSEMAVDLAQVAATEARAAALELQSNVVRSYIQLAMHHAHLDIAEAELKQLEELLELAQERQRIGLGTQQEVTDAEAPLPEAHRQIDLVHEEIALTRNQLAALAGKGPGEGAQIKRPKLSLQGEPQLPSNLPLELLGRRPDVVASRWMVAAQARGIEMAKTDFYPNINLMGTLGTMATKGVMLDFLGQDKLTYGLGPALTLPIFDGGRLRGQLGAASAGYDMAVELYNGTLVRALQSVSDQLIRLKSLHEQEEFVAHSLETAEERVRLAEEAHKRGLTDYSAVLKAKTLLFQQQRLQQQVRATHLSAQSALWVALGGGVLQPGSSPADSKLEPRDVKLHLPGQP